MKKTHYFRSAVLTTGLFILQVGQAQVTVEANVPFSPSFDYVGWDNTTTVPLMIRHNGNQPIQWWTDSIQRMQLYRSQNSTINGFPRSRESVTRGHLYPQKRQGPRDVPGAMSLGSQECGHPACFRRALRERDTSQVGPFRASAIMALV